MYVHSILGVVRPKSSKALILSRPYLTVVVKLFLIKACDKTLY